MADKPDDELTAEEREARIRARDEVIGEIKAASNSAGQIAHWTGSRRFRAFGPA